MNQYKISLDGCDDSTKFEVELTETEAETIRKVAKIANDTAGTSNCKPTISIEDLSL